MTVTDASLRDARTSDDGVFSGAITVKWVCAELENPGGEHEALEEVEGFMGSRRAPGFEDFMTK